MHLSALYIYPVKSMSGSALSSAQLFARGLEMDRRWMWVNAQGQFLTQREYPQMVLWQVTVDDQFIFFKNEKKNRHFSIPRSFDSANRMNVRVWGDEVEAIVMEHPDLCLIAEDFLSEAKLVFLSEESIRQVDQRCGQELDLTSFADGFPLLVCHQSSLEELNATLHEPVSMLHFRPNIVVVGGEAYEEDRWRQLQIGEAILDLVKPCGRCVMINVNPLTAEKNPAVLKGLAVNRTAGNKVLFGMNAISRSNGLSIEVGMKVHLLSVES